MGTVRSFDGIAPQLGADVFVAETAAVIGDVIVGDRTSIWYGAVIRGDVFHIRIGSDVSVQDNTVIHVTSGRHPTLVGDKVTIGHSVILHGCTISDRCIVGMGAVVMDEAVVGEQCIVGAGALVTPGTVIEPGYLVLGSPARPKRRLTDDELAWIDSSAEHYVELAARYLAGS